MQKHEFGKTASDKITGFKGIITGYARYMTGCDQYLLAPKCMAKETGKYPRGQWFDDNRLTIGKDKRVTLDVKKGKSGACGEAPIK